MTRFRLLLLGNSHLASLKLGWDETANQYRGLECLFFGAPAAWTDHAILQAGSIHVTHKPLAEKVAQISGGVSSVRLADFDAICVVGMFFGFGYCMHELRRVHTHAIAPLRPNSQLVSRACLKQIMHDTLSTSPAFDWAKRIKQTSAKPVLLVPAPLSSETRLETDKFIRPIAKEFRTYIADIFELYQSVIQSLVSVNHLILVEQPPHTVAFTGFTRAEFSRGSHRLLNNEKHRDEDFTHMNEMFGIELLHEIVKAVDPANSATSTAVATAD